MVRVIFVIIFAVICVASSNSASLEGAVRLFPIDESIETKPSKRTLVVT